MTDVPMRTLRTRFRIVVPITDAEESTPSTSASNGEFSGQTHGSRVRADGKSSLRFKVLVHVPMGSSSEGSAPNASMASCRCARPIGSSRE